MGTGEQHSTHFPSPLSISKEKKTGKMVPLLLLLLSSHSENSLPFFFLPPSPTPSLRGSLENYILIIWERGRRPTTPAIRAQLWLALTTCLLIISLALPTVLRKPSYGSAATAAISLTEGVFFRSLCPVRRAFSPLQSAPPKSEFSLGPPARFLRHHESGKL